MDAFIRKKYIYLKKTNNYGNVLISCIEEFCNLVVLNRK